ncbi:hypothetical protein G6F23_013404 [Rhizopus arrhizus]|nr:hypothetical protein G6F23_013404 [Rhizopus arrhizus]
MINEAKSILVPTQRLERLGFVLDTTTMKAELPKKKFNNASTIVTVCDSSGSFVHEAPTLLQKFGSEISFGLGHASTTRQRINPRADMVAHQLGEMERTVIYPNLSTGNNICRRERHGLGMLVEQADYSWLLDSNGSESINQLARTEGSLIGDASIPVSEEHHHIDQNQQSHQFSVYQQTGRHSLPASPQLSDRSLELGFTTGLPTSSLVVSSRRINGKFSPRCLQLSNDFGVRST